MIEAFAVVLTLCTGPLVETQCNDYYITVEEQQSSAYAELVHESDMFALAWTAEDSNKALAYYLGKFNIEEDTRLLTDYDFTVQALEPDTTP